MEAGKQGAQGRSLLSREVYCVCFPLRDGLDALQGELAAARQKFFKGGRKTVKVGRREIVKGFDGDLRGKLSHWTFFWKKTVQSAAGGKRITLEQAFDHQGGYVLVTRDFLGVIVSRVFFDKGHAWQKSEYYEPWDPSTARVLFKPAPLEDTIERFDWDSEKKLYNSVLLHPTPYRAGTAEQALVNARLGEPQLLVSMDEGALCYCPQEEAEAREKAYEEIKGGTMVVMPAWEVKEGAYPNGQPTVTFPSLDAYAQVDGQGEPDPQPVLEEDLSEEENAGEMSLELILADAGQGASWDIGPPARALAASHPDGFDTKWFSEEEEILQAARRANEAVQALDTDSEALLAAARRAAQPEQIPNSPPEDTMLFTHKKRNAKTPAAPENAPQAAEAPQLPDAPAVQDAPQDGDAGHLPDTPTTQPEEPAGPVPDHDAPPAEEARPVEQQPPAESSQAEDPQAPAAAPEPENDAYTPRHSGRGRSTLDNGMTVYDGEYLNGKRHGFGSHYYKSGDLSYAGFWRDGKKNGLGVSFREGDHAVHVTRWTDGRPGEVVSLFDPDGNLRFGGFIENGQKHGAGVSISGTDGSVIVAKWEHGENTGLASVFDPEGNLLYYGSWKDGKRHGHGTEFDRNGSIIFDGEWRDDQYFNGILYQKPDSEAAEPEAEPEDDVEDAGLDWDM